MNTLYCIKHNQMVKAYHGVRTGLFHLYTVELNNSPDPGTRFDVEDCLFESGWATTPPPDFEMERFMMYWDYANENENFVEADKVAGYDYDSQTDQLIQWEVLP